MVRFTETDLQNYHARQVRQPAKSTDGEAKEGSIHEKIIKFCGQQWPRWKHIHSRMDLKSTIEVGAQDFTIFIPNGGVLCVECKAKGKKLDNDQLVWKHEMSKLGHIVHVVQSFDEFMIIVKQFTYYNNNQTTQ